MEAIAPLEHSFEEDVCSEQECLVENLTWAAQEIFKPEQTNTYRQIQSENYHDFDLEAWGKEELFHDLYSLVELLSLPHFKSHPPRRVLIVGAGPGRLFKEYIELLSAVGAQEIVFNDLLPEHIASLKRHYLAFRNESAPRKHANITMLQGDIAELSTKNTKYDLVIAQWYVTCEILDTSSHANLLQCRTKFLKNIHSLLSDGGIFFEEVPDVDSPESFWRLAALNSEYALSAALNGSHHEWTLGAGLVLSYYGHLQSGSPYHIRFMPNFEHIRKERESVGLVCKKYYGSRCRKAPKPLDGFMKNISKIYSDKKSQEIWMEHLRTLEPVCLGFHLGTAQRMSILAFWTKHS